MGEPDSTCCWGYEDCVCGPWHGDCHDCHCMQIDCDECGAWLLDETNRA